MVLKDGGDEIQVMKNRGVLRTPGETRETYLTENGKFRKIHRLKKKVPTKRGDVRFFGGYYGITNGMHALYTPLLSG